MLSTVSREGTKNDFERSTEKETFSIQILICLKDTERNVWGTICQTNYMTSKIKNTRSSYNQNRIEPLDHTWGHLY